MNYIRLAVVRQNKYGDSKKGYNVRGGIEVERSAKGKEREKEV